MLKGAACKAVFETYEMLDNTLSFLPQKDLVLYKRVSKQFKSVIDGSATIQDVMFLRPVYEPRQTWLVELGRRSPGSDVYQRITSIKPISDNPFMLKQTAKRTPGFQVHCLCTPVVLSPCLVGHRSARRPGGTIYDDEVILFSSKSKDRIHRHYRQQIGGQQQQQRSTVLDTYISKPACRRVAVYNEVNYRFPGGLVEIRRVASSFSIELEAGITLRDIFTAAFTSKGPIEVRRYDDDADIPRHLRKHNPAFEPPKELFDNVSMDDVVQQSMSRGDILAADIGKRRSRIGVHVCIPTDKEWATVVPYKEDAADT